MTLEKKTYTGQIALKADGEPGEFGAEFATLNVEDLDHDVTLPGAFSAQKVLVEPWNHNYSQVPVGRGEIAEQGEKAVLAGKFFLDTASGLEHYTVVKALADMQEWSYSFVILEAEFGKFNGKDVRFLKKLDVFGVGPVTRGAGIDTRVTSIKGQKPNGDGGEAGSSGNPSGVGAAYYRTWFQLLQLED